MRPPARQRLPGSAGFSLVELAIVLLVVTLMLSSLLYTLSAQTEQRARETTLRRLEEAKELLIAFEPRDLRCVAKHRGRLSALLRDLGSRRRRPTRHEPAHRAGVGFLDGEKWRHGERARRR